MQVTSGNERPVNIVPITAVRYYLIYDDSCDLCLKWLERVRRLDVDGLIRPVPLSNPVLPVDLDLPPWQRQLEESYLPRFFWIPRVMFWLFLLSGCVVMLTMLVSMLPLFGSEGLEILLDIHRYAGLLAVVTLLIHFYSVLLQRAQLR